MNILAPSILAADFAALGQQIEEAESAGAQYLHIDVMDGMFVPSISFGMPLISSIRPRTRMFFDVHMMVAQPERYAEELVRCGANGVTIHEEACDCIADTLARIRALGARAGLAINPETPVERLFPYLDSIDMALVMTVHPGFGGQTYIDACTDKIRAVRERIDALHTPVRLEIDGGVTAANLRACLDAGADTIVAGSAIFRGNIADNTRELLDMMR